MAKDYVLFVHGVNTREDDPAHPQYAKALIDDITPRLQTFLDATALHRNGKPLPWLNFAHPGDALAYPLDPLLAEMVDGERRYLKISDHVQELLNPLAKVVDLTEQNGCPYNGYKSACEVSPYHCRGILYGCPGCRGVTAVACPLIRSYPRTSFRFKNTAVRIVNTIVNTTSAPQASTIRLAASACVNVEKSVP